MNILRTIRSSWRTAINLCEFAVIFLLLTACPPYPPPDDEVPVRPSHEQPTPPLANC